MDNFPQSFLNLKSLSLILLSTLSLAFGLILPLSRKPDANGNRFFGPSGVFLMESLKIVISIIGLYLKHFYNRQEEVRKQQNIYLPIAREMEEEKAFLLNEGESSTSDTSISMIESNEGEGEFEPISENSFFRELKEVTYLAWKDVWNVGAFHLAIPSILYVFQNNLQLFSAGFLKPAEFQVFSQFKLVTTALFSVWLLKKSLVIQHWISIVILCLGIILVKGADKLLYHDQSVVSVPGLWTKGVPSILGACCFSGLAGVLIEIRLKGKKTCFWASNVQLATFSLLPALVPIIFDSIKNQKFDPFRHFNGIVWAMILINVAGGVLVSMVIKYADNILKNFAISVSVILTIFVSSYLTGLSVTILQISGAVLVATSTIAYGLAPPPQRTE